MSSDETSKAAASQPDIDLEAASLQMGGPRIKFNTHRVPFTGGIDEREATALADALAEMERFGAAPVLPDGKVGGNGAVRCSDGRMLVSKSGKFAGETIGPRDFALLHSFDRARWSAEFSSPSEAINPSSDSPLLWAALCEGERHGFARSRLPRVALHGHALATPEDAHALGYPISHEQTLFSTREDVDALTALFARHPFPTTRVWIRRGHGFFILADSIDDALAVFRNEIVPHMKRANSNSTAAADRPAAGSKSDAVLLGSSQKLRSRL